MNAVLADPWSDRVRLAWAEAAPPARAELVRLQVALAAAEYGRPRATATRIVALRRAADALVAEHGPTWAGPLSLVAHAVRFERGFVEHVTLDARTFVDGGSLLAAHPLVGVRLTAVHEVAPEALFGAPHLARLAALDLSGAALGDDGVIALANSPWLSGLCWLSLHDNRVGLRGAAALARSDGLPGLRYLAFGANRVAIVPEPRGAGVDGGPSVVDLPDAGRALAERYGPRPWLSYTATDVHAWPPEPYDVLVAEGRYTPGA